MAKSLVLFTAEEVALLRAMAQRFRAEGPPSRGRAAGPRLQGPAPGFWGRITAYAAAGDNRWTYTFEEVWKETAGYDGWAAVTDGRTDTAYNSIEDMNTAAGVQGNGVDVANLDTADYTFEIEPCPVGNVVWIRPVWITGAPEFWFSYANGVDGSCD
ncbi:MAG TPA: hypothetical protein VM219_02015 [Phycisphaerae bacterium]|nr:hypothetical protein [Phycisphaerae bacterium]HUS44796.1 hypothetical protein [Phycisphaerae bacterium]